MTTDDGTPPGPSEEDLAEAHRLRVLHRRSTAEQACLWCREAWPCRHRRWADEVIDAALDLGGDGTGDGTGDGSGASDDGGTE